MEWCKYIIIALISIALAYLCIKKGGTMKKIRYGFEWISYWILRLWYLIVLSISTWYVVSNFDSIRDFSFFDKFNGDNLIFILWLIILVLPLFDSLEGFGVSVKRRKNDEISEKTKAAASDAIDYQNISTITELEQQLNSQENKEVKNGK